jgi:hypothetical protein
MIDSRPRLGALGAAGVLAGLLAPASAVAEEKDYCLKTYSAYSECRYYYGDSYPSTFAVYHNLWQSAVTRVAQDNGQACASAYDLTGQRALNSNGHYDECLNSYGPGVYWLGSHYYATNALNPAIQAYSSGNYKGHYHTY